MYVDHVTTVQVDQPPASSVRKFLALLEQSDIDFSEEIGTSVDESFVFVFHCACTCFN